MRLFLESAFIVLVGRAPHPERRARTHPHFQRPRADSGGWAGQHEGPLRRSVRLDHAGSLSSYIHSLPPLTWYVCVCVNVGYSTGQGCGGSSRAISGPTRTSSSPTASSSTSAPTLASCLLSSSPRASSSKSTSLPVCRGLFLEFNTGKLLGS